MATDKKDKSKGVAVTPDDHAAEQAKADKPAAQIVEDVTVKPNRTTMNIYQKLAAITGRVGAIAKGGNNTEQGYKFIEYAAVAGELRQYFAEYGVVIVPNMPETAQQHRTEFKTRNGGTGLAVLIDFKFDVINADQPDDRFTVGWTGEATDYGDKGTNKAATAALKYYLMRQFNISEKGEQEADNNSPERAAAPEPKAPAAPPPRATIKYITQPQIDKLSAILDSKGMTDTDDQEALVKKMGKVDNVSNITEVSATALIERIEPAEIAKMFEFIGKEFTPSTDVIIEDIDDEPINYADIPDFGAPTDEPEGLPQADTPADDAEVLKPSEPTPPAPKSYDQPAASADPNDVIGNIKPVDDNFKSAVKRSLDALGLQPQVRMRLLKDATGSVTPNTLDDDQWRAFANAVDEYAIKVADQITGNDEIKTQNDGGELNGVTDQSNNDDAGNTATSDEVGA